MLAGRRQLLQQGTNLPYLIHDSSVPLNVCEKEKTSMFPVLDTNLWETSKNFIEHSFQRINLFCRLHHVDGGEIKSEILPKVSETTL